MPTARRGQAKFATNADEDAQKAVARYSGAPAQGSRSESRQGQGRSSAWVLGGPLIVSFKKGDVRFTIKGLEVYGDEERWLIEVPVEQDGRHQIVQNFYGAAVHDKRPVNDERWGVATLEVLLAIKQSGHERKEAVFPPGRDKQLSPSVQLNRGTDLPERPQLLPNG